ncbi:MAG: SDR family oxidoreductase [Deltaproteobacteria bacterium]|nr:MAG: SDR family oxidoreductase [Deltaproteobacteria bacterium]
MTNELAGRVAIVTGAGRNIGRAIALALADAGAAVAVNGRANRAEVDAVVAEIESRGGRALALMADVSDEPAVQRMAGAVADRLGRIDILVNNAAVRPEKPFESLSLADWRAVHSVILDGAFLTVKAALPHLKASGSGAVINIGGMSAHTGARQRAHVLAAKSGLIGFTKALACDLAGDGITANCVVPGLIDTVRAPGTKPPQHHQSSKTLVGRSGTPQDIAAAVRFLAGPEARYITGQSLHVNGGAYLG